MAEFELTRCIFCNAEFEEAQPTGIKHKIHCPEEEGGCGHTFKVIDYTNSEPVAREKAAAD